MTHGGIYMASKTRHAALWRALRASGVPIISTWIDEAGVGETSSFTNLWERCVSESARCAALIVYAEEGDVLKGAFIEVGVALGAGRPVYVCGPVPGSFTHHPLVTTCSSIEQAIDHAKQDHLKALTPV